MYLINTSFHTERKSADDIIEEVSAKLKPLMQASSLFTSITMAEILVEVDPDCISFTLQGITPDLDKAMKWLQNEGATFFNDLHNRYGQKVVFFTTPMRIIQ